MNIKRIDNFNLFGYELTHKSLMVPKTLTKFYYNTNPKSNVKNKFVQKFKEIIGKIFHNYEVETFEEWSFNDRTSLDYDIVESIINGTSKNLFFKPTEIEEMKKLDYYDEIAFLRKLEKEGRFKKPINE